MALYVEDIDFIIFLSNCLERISGEKCTISHDGVSLVTHRLIQRGSGIRPADT
jgi:hypothetical protein